MGLRPLRREGASADPRPVGESLDALAQRFGVDEARSHSAVFNRWEQAVGPAVAAHARPLYLRDGELVVAVDHPAWATQLRLLADQLLARLSPEGGPPIAARVRVKVQAPWSKGAGGGGPARM